MTIHPSGTGLGLARWAMRAVLLLGLPMLGVPPAYAATTAADHIDIELTNTGVSRSPGRVNFRVTVRNRGQMASGARLTAQVVGYSGGGQMWSCFGSDDAPCPQSEGVGDIDVPLDNLPTNGSLEYDIQVSGGQVDGSPDNVGVTGNPLPPFLTYSAEVTLPPGGTCADGATPPCRAVFSAGTGAAIRSSFTRPVPPYFPGGPIQYGFSFSNDIGDAAGSVVRAPLPAGLASMTWTCEAVGGAACPAASGNGAIDQTIGTWPGEGRLEYAVNGILTQGDTGSLTVTALAIPPYGGTCDRFGLPPCLASWSESSPIFSVQQTATRNGTEARFDVRITNIGGAASQAPTFFYDEPPSELDDFTWTCTGSGITCPSSEGSFSVSDMVALWPTGATLNYRIRARIANPESQVIINRFVVEPPKGGSECAPPLPFNPPCISAASPPGYSGAIDVGLSAEAAPIEPGGSVLLSAFVVNPGYGGSAMGSRFRLPAVNGLSIGSWSCIGYPQSACAEDTGTGPIDTLLNLDFEDQAYFVISSTVDSTPPPQIVARAELTPGADYDPLVGCASGEAYPCTSTVALSVMPVLELSNVAMRPGYADGGNLDYVLRVTNQGPEASNVRIVDNQPSGIFTMPWTCSFGGSETCGVASGTGSIDQTFPTLDNGQSVYFNVAATVSTAPPAAITNTLEVSADPPYRCVLSEGGELVEPSPTCRLDTTIQRSAQLNLQWSASQTQLVRGGSGRWRLDLHNDGGDGAGTVLSVAQPTGIAQQNWLCSAYGGALCPTVQGSGAITATVTALPPGSSLSYQLDSVVDGSSPPTTITQTATLTPPTPGDCTGAGCSVSLTLPVSEQPSANLALSMTSTSTTATALGTVHYTLELRNIGSQTASLVRITNPLPAGVTALSWQCIGFDCDDSEGTGAIDQTLVSLPVYSSEGDQGRVVYQIEATVDATPPATITNVATVLPSGADTCAGGACSASVTVQVPQALLEVTKTADRAELMPGGQVNYTVKVTNLGDLAVADVALRDLTPPGLIFTSWTCSSSGPGAQCPSITGSGDINANFGLGAGAGLTWQVLADVSSAASGISSGTGSVVTNRAELTMTGGAPCADGVCAVDLTLPLVSAPVATLAVTKTANQAELVPGGMVVYTVEARNIGNAAAAGVSLSDPLPTGIASVNWSCTPLGADSSCPAASGTGALAATFEAFPGEGLRWTITAAVSTGATGVVTNRATLTPPMGASCDSGICFAEVALPVAGTPPVASVTVTQGATPPGGTTLNPGSAVTWTLVATGSVAPTASTLTLTDTLPSNANSIQVSPDTGVVCNASNPAPGSILTCTIESGFIGERSVTIDAIVTGPDGVGELRNVVQASGSDNPTCVACTVVHPVVVPAPVQVSVVKTATPAAGTTLNPGNAVTWTLAANSSGSPTSGTVTLTDTLPSNAGNIQVNPGSGVTCNASNPAPGSSLICTIESGFTGQRSVAVSAIVSGPGGAGELRNTVQASGPDNPTCSTCTVVHPVVVPVPTPVQVSVTKTATPAGGEKLTQGQTVTWLLNASSTAAPTSGVVTLTDRLPSNVSGIQVNAGSGVSCNASDPIAGSDLVCTIPAGFTGQRSVTVRATVGAPDANGTLRNTLSASGIDAPTCSACTVVHPVEPPPPPPSVDVALRNPRAYTAGGVPGTLFDVANLSSNRSGRISVSATPASALRLFASSVPGCTATSGAGGSVVVGCPSPPSPSEAVTCYANNCIVSQLGAGSNVTLFIALNAGASLGVKAETDNDSDTSNNTLTLPVGATP